METREKSSNKLQDSKLEDSARLWRAGAFENVRSLIMLKVFSSAVLQFQILISHSVACVCVPTALRIDALLSYFSGQVTGMR
jgi:hypothetical protein